MQINSYVNRYAVYEEASQALLKVKAGLYIDWLLKSRSRLSKGWRNTGRRMSGCRNKAWWKEAVFLPVGRRQELDQAGQIYEQRRKEYEGQQEEYDQKTAVYRIWRLPG